jgi:hypothetical protein
LYHKIAQLRIEFRKLGTLMDSVEKVCSFVIISSVRFPEIYGIIVAECLQSGELLAKQKRCLLVRPPQVWYNSRRMLAVGSGTPDGGAAQPTLAK